MGSPLFYTRVEARNVPEFKDAMYELVVGKLPLLKPEFKLALIVEMCQDPQTWQLACAWFEEVIGA